MSSLFFSYSLTSYIITDFFSISLRFIYFQVGRVIGYSSRHLVISWPIAGDILILFMVGFFVESKMGTYFVNIL